MLEGKSIAGWKSPDIALAGIARTFQNVQLFGELTLIENILVGLNHAYNGGVADVALATGRARREEKAARQRAASLLHFVGLAAQANEESKNLPYGKQRLLEIAPRPGARSQAAAARRTRRRPDRARHNRTRLDHPQGPRPRQSPCC